MTISESLKLAITKLSVKKNNLPHLEAEILLSKILKKPREFILAHGKRELTKLQIVNYKLLIKERLKRIPIAYITGEKEFYGLKFKVNRNVLIPRPETELMVEEALKLAAQNSQLTTPVDVGTGSGCVIITLAKQITNYELPSSAKASEDKKITNYKFLATDISTKALSVAKQNARHHGVAKKIKFLRGNLLEPLTKILDSRFRGNDKKKKLLKSKFVILANLPYLTPTQIKNSPSIKHEPKLALTAGSDGLKYYRQLFKQIKTLNITGYVLCEIDPGQTTKIKQLIKRELPEANFQIKKDLSGLNRLVMVKIV